MKVVCIDDTKWHNDSMCPSFGEICTVDKSFVSPITGIPVYSFLEYPVEPPSRFRCFHQNLFIHLSDIDECELVNIKEECA